jgi:hypothetical protein
MIKAKLTNCYHKECFSGIGDFFRGSIHLYEECKENNIRFGLSLGNHPIGEFLKFKDEDCPDKELIYDIPLKYSKTEKSIGLPEFSFLELQKIIEVIKDMDGGNKFVFSNYHKILHKNMISYINSFNSLLLSDDLCKWFRKNLYFSEDVDDFVDSFLRENNISKNEFQVMHFRLGDLQSFSIENEKKESFEKDIDYFIEIIKRQQNTNLLILSDNNDFKDLISKHKDEFKYPIYTVHKKSSHCQKTNGHLDLDNNKNSFLYLAVDLKLMTIAQRVDSYSSYFWGSGFSCWISKLFSVPFICRPFFKNGEIKQY